MNVSTRIAPRLGLIMLLLMVSGAEAAEPAWGRHLAKEVRGAWKRDVARARQADAAAFSQARAAIAEATARPFQTRSGRAPVAQNLASLGPRALWPLVELLALEELPAEARGTAPEADVVADLVEATGALRDARLEPLWLAILARTEEPPRVLRAATEALARLESDSAARELVTLSRRPGPPGEAVLEAMGHCRRLVVAQRLAQALDARPDAETARRIARSLGDVGSAWAWASGSVPARTEEGAIRRVAAEALVRAWLPADDETRLALTGALLRVDAPGTLERVETHRARAPDSERAEWDALAARLRRNPLRR